MESFEVRLGGTVVNRVRSVKYLGLTLDQYFDFSLHIEGLLKKASSRLRFLYRSAGFLDFRTRRMLCQSLVASTLEYCSPAWYPGIKKGLMDRLDTMQRKLVRYVCSMDFMTHVGVQEFRTLNWMPFSSRVRYSSLVHLFKIKRGLAPDYMTEDFQNVRDVHSYNLRNRENFSLARNRFPLGTFNRCGISAWNELPVHLKEITTLQLFKTRLRAHIMSQ